MDINKILYRLINTYPKSPLKILQLKVSHWIVIEFNIELLLELGDLSGLNVDGGLLLFLKETERLTHVFNRRYK